MNGHRVWRRAVVRQFSGGAPAGAAAALYAHLSACRDCADLYERHARAESILCGSADTVFARERTGQAVLDRVAPEARKSARWPLSPWLWAAAALTAAAIVVVHQPVDEVSDSPEYVARSAPAAAAAAVGIRMLRVSPADEVASDGARVEETDTFALGDVVTFTYTNRDASLRYLTLLGLQGGDLHRYSSDQLGGGSVAIVADRVDEPLGDGIRLAAGHREGPLRVLAIFSPEPLAETDLRAAAGALAGPGTAELPVPGAAMYTLEVSLVRPR